MTARIRRFGRSAKTALFWIILGATPASAEEVVQETAPSQVQSWAVHGQATFVDQAHAEFTSPYQGANSLAPFADGRETLDITLIAGFRPWRGAEVWINPEIDQGFGLSDTLGVAGFPSGEAYKVGKSSPYFRLQRLFVRQMINISGKVEKVDPDLNQLGGAQAENRLVVTAGKFAVTDVFDTSKFAHDPKHDFLNWALIDTGTFDYAADAWGYTVGVAAEWYQGDWTVRGGAFDLSDVPNSERLDARFAQFQLEGEIERRYAMDGRSGALKITGFLSRGRMGRFDDAIALGVATGEPANVALVRRYRSREGVSFNVQQELSGDLGLFVRGGLAGGDIEPYEFADIDRTVAAGMSMNGKRWGRPNDTLALAGIVNAISAEHQRYLAAGGLGILIGDGRLPHPGDEGILETYYDLALGRYVRLAADFQFVDNPGYNRDRGPVPIIAVRIHAQF